MIDLTVLKVMFFCGLMEVKCKIMSERRWRSVLFCEEIKTEPQSSSGENARKITCALHLNAFRRKRSLFGCEKSSIECD